MPAAADRTTGPAAMLRAVAAASTWLAVIHLLVGLFIGVFLFAVLLAGLATGVATLPFFLLGIPVLAGTLKFFGIAARFERARYAFFLGSTIPAAPVHKESKWWLRTMQPLRSAAAWRRAAYGFIRFPLSVQQFVVLVTVWSIGPALLAAPLYNFALPGGGAHLFGHLVRGPVELTAAVLAGLLVLLVAPQVTYALAREDEAVARWLLASASSAKLNERISELETSRARVMDAAEAERQRIERDLHDGAQQRLVALAIELGRAKSKFALDDPDAAAAIVGQAHEQAKQALAELRNLVRGVHPPVLTDRGLDAALSGLAALSPVPVTLRVDLPARPPVSVEAIAYFVVAEALTNVAKHARASHAEVTVTRSGDLLTLVIADDGAGGADPGGQGLSGLAARVAGVDGRLTVTSPPGGPTSVKAVLPCGS